VILDQAPSGGDPSPKAMASDSVARRAFELDGIRYDAAMADGAYAAFARSPYYALALIWRMALLASPIR
jgi:hypothetical protein